VLHTVAFYAIFATYGPLNIAAQPLFTSISFDTMRFLSFLYPALLCASGAEALRSDKVKLSNIQSLTLRKGLDTSHRRVDAMPQVCSSCSAFRTQADF
jgi:hypothetical protein